SPPPAITWEQARSMRDHPLIDFQAHGTSHKRLTALSDADLEYELAGVKAEIETRREKPVTTLCYAAGLVGDRSAAAAEARGDRARGGGCDESSRPGPRPTPAGSRRDGHLRDAEGRRTRSVGGRRGDRDEVARPRELRQGEGDEDHPRQAEDRRRKSATHRPA